jgi:hypothetical protein
MKDNSDLIKQRYHLLLHEASDRMALLAVAMTTSPCPLSTPSLGCTVSRAHQPTRSLGTSEAYDPKAKKEAKISTAGFWRPERNEIDSIDLQR